MVHPCLDFVYILLLVTHRLEAAENGSGASREKKGGSVCPKNLGSFLSSVGEAWLFSGMTKARLLVKHPQA
jgi:hypothetical protein